MLHITIETGADTAPGMAEARLDGVRLSAGSAIPLPADGGEHQLVIRGRSRLILCALRRGRTSCHTRILASKNSFKDGFFMHAPLKNFPPIREKFLPAPAAAPNVTVLLVDADTAARQRIIERLSRENLTVIEASDLTAARQQLGKTVDVVLLDRHVAEGHGPGTVETLTRDHADIPVIVIDNEVSVDHAVDAAKHGAFHYVPKTGDLTDLVLYVHKAVEASRLRPRLRLLRTQPGVSGRGLEMIVGESAAIQHVKGVLARVAASPASTVLLLGETGTGKDLAARALHDTSDRAARPFVQITCSALPEQLLESELFGHERGAFTDARQQKRGLLETADGGTVFLDEIGEMTLPLQAKLLRFLEDKTFKRVGGLQDIRVDVRVIAATHRDLPRHVRDGHFREDLYYRLRVMPIYLPPLRERGDDVRLLAEFFVERYNREFRKAVRGISADALHLLERYQWPGNVRELRNTIERAMLLMDREWIEAADLALPSDGHAQAPFQLPDEGVSLDEVERQLLIQALAHARGNQTRAGELLGISRDQVRYRMRKFGVGGPRRRRRVGVASAA
jgi:DNA-binding NtrC family response regulator